MSHERQDLGDRRVGVALVCLCVLIAAGFGLAALAGRVLGGPPEGSLGAVGVWQPGDAPLPSDELAEQRRAAEAAWATEAAASERSEGERGVAVIPVERAAELLLRDGFPARAGRGDD